MIINVNLRKKKCPSLKGVWERSTLRGVQKLNSLQKQVVVGILLFALIEPTQDQWPMRVSFLNISKRLASQKCNLLTSWKRKKKKRGGGQAKKHYFRESASLPELYHCSPASLSKLSLPLPLPLPIANRAFPAANYSLDRSPPRELSLYSRSLRSFLGSLEWVALNN